MSAEAFNPRHLDCDQWIRIAKEAGMKYAVFTAKHHDGFANWPTNYTNYSVTASPWKAGKGDVVREYIDACEKYDMKKGIYYSPADAENKAKKTGKEYDDYFISQISELLTWYGKIDILWFDGCGSEGHIYDWNRISKEIRILQPEIMIFNMGDLDFRWIGNECGLAPIPVWNTTDAVHFSVNTDEMESLESNDSMWLPAECDCRMREENWFYSEYDENTVKSLERLMGIYYYSVGRGTNLLLNIGPNRDGLLPQKDSKRLIEFGNEIRRRFSNPVITLDKFLRNEQKWSFEFPQNQEPIIINHVVIGEELSQGEHVKKFRIVVLPYGGSHTSITVYEGYNIGHKAICRFPAICAKKVIFEILEFDGQPEICDLNFFHIEE